MHPGDDYSDEALSPSAADAGIADPALAVSATSTELPQATAPPDPPVATWLTGIHIQRMAGEGTSGEALWQVVLTFDHGPKLLVFVRNTTPGSFAQEIIILQETVQQALPQFRQQQLAQIAAQRAAPPRPTAPPPARPTPSTTPARTKRGGKGNGTVTPPPVPVTTPVAAVSQPSLVALPTAVAPIDITNIEQATLF